MSRNSVWLKRVFGIAICVILGVVLAGCSGITNSQNPEDWQPTIWNCWPCALYGSVFQIVDDISRIAVTESLGLSQAILGLGLALFMAFQAGKMFLPFTETKDMVKMGHEAAFVFLKALMVGLLLYKAEWFLYFMKQVVIMPVGQFFTVLSNAVLDSLPGTGEYFGALPGIEPEMKKVVIDIAGEMEELDPDVSLFDTLGIQVQYIVSRIFRSLQTGGALVQRLLAHPGLYSWLIGLVAGYQIWKLLTMFPLAFVDSFIQIAYMVILAPITIALWVFPGQDKYLKAIFPSKILGPFMDVLFGCIFVVLMITTLQLYTELCLGDILNPEMQLATSAWADSAVSGSPNILIMMLLFVAISKLCFVIYDFTTLFGGSPGSGSLMQVMDKMRALARKVLVSYITSGGNAAMAAKKAAEEAAKEAASTAGGGGP